MSTRFRNWAGQHGCAPRTVVAVATAEDVQRAVARANDEGRHLRVFGAGHSPSDMAMSDDILVTVEGLNRVLAVDVGARRVVAEAGASLTAIDDALHAHGLALPNLGSISAQTIGGAIATATHGTGLGYGTLSSLVAAVTLVTGTGQLLRIARGQNEAWLDGVRCHLGALGVLIDVTLDVSEAFDLVVRETARSLDDALSHLDARAADHVRLWYLPHVDRVWEWRAMRERPRAARSPNLAERAARWGRDRLVGHHAFELALYLASWNDALVPAVNRAYARAMFTRPRTARGRSRDMFVFDCLFKQHVDEWAIPIEHAGAALRELRRLIAQHDFRVHLPIEVRFVNGESVWLSPAHGRDSCYIGVIAYMPYGRATAHRAYFAAFESLMMRFHGRPHWAKRFGPDATQLRALYPRWQDFMNLRATLDPSGVFANGYTDRVLGPVLSQAGGSRACA